jgi:hypothetical protein
MAKQQQLSPVVRVAPMGELRIYPITEAELDELARGSSGGIYLNFALFFAGLAISLIVTLNTTTMPDRRFYVFVIFFAATLVAALVLGVLWFVQHRSTKNLAKQIRERMPRTDPIQEIIPAADQVVLPRAPQQLPPA